MPTIGEVPSIVTLRIATNRLSRLGRGYPEIIPVSYQSVKALSHDGKTVHVDLLRDRFFSPNHSEIDWDAFLMSLPRPSSGNNRGRPRGRPRSRSGSPVAGPSGIRNRSGSQGSRGRPPGSSTSRRRTARSSSSSSSSSSGSSSSSSGSSSSSSRTRYRLPPARGRRSRSASPVARRRSRGSGVKRGRYPMHVRLGNPFTRDEIAGTDDTYMTIYRTGDECDETDINFPSPVCQAIRTVCRNKNAAGRYRAFDPDSSENNKYVMKVKYLNPDGSTIRPG